MQAALNPENSQRVSYEQVLRALARFSAGLAWETPAGVRAPLDALHLLATFLQANKVRGQGGVGVRTPLQQGVAPSVG